MMCCVMLHHAAYLSTFVFCIVTACLCVCVLLRALVLRSAEFDDDQDGTVDRLEVSQRSCGIQDMGLR